MKNITPPRNILVGDLHKLASEWSLKPYLSSDFAQGVLYNIMIGILEEKYNEFWTIELDPENSGMYVAQQH